MYTRVHSHAFIVRPQVYFVYHTLRTIAVLAALLYLLPCPLRLSSLSLPYLGIPHFLFGEPRVIESIQLYHELAAVNSTVSYSPFL
jgi:hypothetical protein